MRHLQRAAALAPALTLLTAACDEPTSPQASSPSSAPAAWVGSHAYLGRWALAGFPCTAGNIWEFEPTRLSIAPGERSCRVLAVAAQPGTARRRGYMLAASCMTEGERSHDRFRLVLDASDTMMTAQLNRRAPVRLDRCP